MIRSISADESRTTGSWREAPAPSSVAAGVTLAGARGAASPTWPRSGPEGRPPPSTSIDSIVLGAAPASTSPALDLHLVLPSQRETLPVPR